MVNYAWEDPVGQGMIKDYIIRHADQTAQTGSDKPNLSPDSLDPTSTDFTLDLAGILTVLLRDNRRFLKQEIYRIILS